MRLLHCVRNDQEGVIARRALARRGNLILPDGQIASAFGLAMTRRVSLRGVKRRSNLIMKRFSYQGSGDSNRGMFS